MHGLKAFVDTVCFREDVEVTMTKENCVKAELKKALARKYESLSRSPSAKSSGKKRKYRGKIARYLRQAATLCQAKPAG